MDRVFKNTDAREMSDLHPQIISKQFEREARSRSRASASFKSQGEYRH